MLVRLRRNSDEIPLQRRKDCGAHHVGRLRTVSTGQAACRTTFSATLPRIAWETRLRP